MKTVYFLNQYEHLERVSNLHKRDTVKKVHFYRDERSEVLDVQSRIPNFTHFSLQKQLSVNNTEKLNFCI